MFKELILSTIISTSLSIKTSNDDMKPNDYEFMIQAEKNTDRFAYFIKRDWERELGNKYIDNIFKIKYVNSKNIYCDIVLSGADYHHSETLLDQKYRRYSESLNTMYLFKLLD